MGSICHVTQSQETGFKCTIWNQGLGIRGMRSVVGLKIQCYSECHIGQCNHRHVPTTRIKNPLQEKSLQIEDITYIGQNIAQWSS